MPFAVKQLERPFRTPKNVPHLTAEPGFTRAGCKGRWTLRFVLARHAPPDHRFFLQIHGKRSNLIPWPGLQTDDENAEGYLCLTTDSHGALKPLEVLDNRGLFEFELPPGGLAGGEHISVDVGGPMGVMAPAIATSSKFFLLEDGP